MGRRGSGKVLKRIGLSGYGRTAVSFLSRSEQMRYIRHGEHQNANRKRTFIGSTRPESSKLDGVNPIAFRGEVQSWTVLPFTLKRSRRLPPGNLDLVLRGIGKETRIPNSDLCSIGIDSPNTRESHVSGGIIQGIEREFECGQCEKGVESEVEGSEGRAS